MTPSVILTTFARSSAISLRRCVGDNYGSADASISRTISFFHPAGGEPGRRCWYDAKRRPAEKEQGEYVLPGNILYNDATLTPPDTHQRFLAVSR